MRRYFAAGMLLVMLSLTAGGAHAQETQEAERDTTVVRQRVVRRSPAVYRRSVPASVRQVRVRTARIGPGGAVVRRIIYPMIVIPSTPQVIYVRDAQSGRMAPRVGGESLPLSRRYGDLLDDGGLDDDGDLLRFLRRRGEEGPIIRFRDEGEAADSTAVPPSNAPLAEAPPVTVRRIERALLNRGLFRATGVHFEFDQADILPTFYPTLETVAEVMQMYPALRIKVAGHTDAIGSEAYNQDLSIRRAQAVRTYLIERVGIDPDRLVARGYGESQPVASNESPTGRTLNRRVEFRLLNPEAVEPYVEERVEEREAPAAAEEESLREALRRVIREELERVQADTTERR